MDITVAICTMNRPGPLRETLAALSRQESMTPGSWEVLVVDDGDLSGDWPGLEAALGGTAPLRRRAKAAPDAPGLYGSRIVAADEARGSWILFLDDDAEPDPGYLSTLAALARARPDAAGFGGIDRNDLPRAASVPARLYARAFLLSGSGPGSLGATGWNHAQMTWRAQRGPFRSEFLHGCNMAFRRDALRDLPGLDWLSGHSCCEDLVISVHAARSGAVEIHPALSVVHRPAEGGRGTSAERLAASLRNHLLFQAWRGRPRRLLGAWSLLGLLAKDVLVARGKRGLPTRSIASAYLHALATLTGGRRPRGRPQADAAPV